MTACYVVICMQGREDRKERGILASNVRNLPNFSGVPALNQIQFSKWPSVVGKVVVAESCPVMTITLSLTLTKLCTHGVRFRAYRSTPATTLSPTHELP